MEKQRDNTGDDLANDRCIGGAADAQRRTAKQTVNQNRIQNNIGHGTGNLRNGGKKRLSGCLQQLFKAGKKDYAEGDTAADAQIRDCHVDDERVVALGLHIGTHADKTECNRYDTDDQREKLGISGNAVDFFTISFPQGAR